MWGLTLTWDVLKCTILSAYGLLMKININMRCIEIIPSVVITFASCD